MAHQSAAAAAASVAKLFDQYVDAAPSAQAAVDALPGWNCALPETVGATAGTLPLYADDRIAWMIERLGSLEGRSVLELGPLEASHTYMMEAAGALRIDAIEANKLAYLRCLVVKELLGMVRARFHLGNFVSWLEGSEARYDLIVASGVLYHLEDPLHALALMAGRSDALFLWTHVVDEVAMPRTDPRRSVFRPTVEVRRFHGLDMRLYPRSYHRANQNAAFCGGLHDDHRWINREDLLALLDRLGFDEVLVNNEEPKHPNGPCLSILARRTGS